MSRIQIFTGHFGSGKTETAINYALRLAEERTGVSLVDMDVVNPYFCSRDVAEDLDRRNVRLISSQRKLANAELGVVSPEVMAAFNDKSLHVVVDVGGDDLGAVALGQFNRYFRSEPYEMYFVVNKRRPATSTQRGVVDCIARVEEASRLKVTHLIANTNMSYETTATDVLEGDAFVTELADALNLPHLYTVCRRDLLDQIEDKVRGQVLAIDIHMKVPWM